MKKLVLLAKISCKMTPEPFGERRNLIFKNFDFKVRFIAAQENGPTIARVQ
jgi:hypothetical protein